MMSRSKYMVQCAVKCSQKSKLRHIIFWRRKITEIFLGSNWRQILLILIYCIHFPPLCYFLSFHFLLLQLDEMCRWQQPCYSFLSSNIPAFLARVLKHQNHTICSVWSALRTWSSICTRPHQKDMSVPNYIECFRETLCKKQQNKICSCAI